MFLRRRKLKALLILGVLFTAVNANAQAEIDDSKSLRAVRTDVILVLDGRFLAKSCWH